MRMLLYCSLDRCIDMFDSPSADIPNSVALMLRNIGHLLFSDIKTRRLEVRIRNSFVLCFRVLVLIALNLFLLLLQAAVEMTRRTHPNNLNVQLDNMRAMLSVDRGTIDPDVSECLFVQLFGQLGRKDPKIWRGVPDSKGSLFQV